jgi:hypothetical protein
MLIKNFDNLIIVFLPTTPFFPTCPTNHPQDPYDYHFQFVMLIWSNNAFIIYLLQWPYLLAKSYDLVVGVYIYIYIILQWAIWLAYHKKHYEFSPPQVKITFLTLFNIYLVLHNHVKSYKYKYFYLLDRIKLHKYIYFCTYTYTVLHNIK